MTDWNPQIVVRWNYRHELWEIRGGGSILHEGILDTAETKEVAVMAGKEIAEQRGVEFVFEGYWREDLEYRLDSLGDTDRSKPEPVPDDEH